MLRITSINAFILALSLVPACTGVMPPADTGAGPDAGNDAAVRDDAGAVDDAARSDAGTADDAAVLDDAGAIADAASVDSGSAIDAASTTDAGPAIDSGAIDAGAANACVAAGGTCVAVIPRACPGGVVGNAAWYACGTGVGVQCCLPANTPPVCRNAGSRSEGWYAADGTRICGAGCTGSTASCGAIGTRSEGWYASDPADGCMTGSALIEWTNCAP